MQAINFCLFPGVDSDEYKRLKRACVDKAATYKDLEALFRERGQTVDSTIEFCMPGLAGDTKKMAATEQAQDLAFTSGKVQQANEQLHGVPAAFAQCDIQQTLAKIRDEQLATDTKDNATRDAADSFELETKASNAILGKASSVATNCDNNVTTTRQNVSAEYAMSDVEGAHIRANTTLVEATAAYLAYPASFELSTQYPICAESREEESTAVSAAEKRGRTRVAEAEGVYSVGTDAAAASHARTTKELADELELVARVKGHIRTFK